MNRRSDAPGVAPLAPQAGSERFSFVQRFGDAPNLTSTSTRSRVGGSWASATASTPAIPRCSSAGATRK